MEETFGDVVEWLMAHAWKACSRKGSWVRIPPSPHRNRLVPIAQLDRVPGYEPGGWGFDSLWVYNKKGGFFRPPFLLYRTLSLFGRIISAVVIGGVDLKSDEKADSGKNSSEREYSVEIQI